MYRIFLADDEALTLEYLQHSIPALRNTWTVCGTARNGREALEKLSRTEVDLLLTDVKMPLMDGIALAAEIRKTQPNALIAVLSGYDDFPIMQSAIRCGIDEYLLKPITDKELLNLLTYSEKKLRQRTERELTFRSLEKLSDDYRHQIAENYLRVLLHGEESEVGIYHPLLHRMKIDMLEGVGSIMLVAVDLPQMLRQGIDASELALYSYLLLVAAKEVAWNLGKGRAIADKNGSVAVFLTAESEEGLRQMQDEAFRQLSRFMAEHFSIRLYAALGSIQMDMLEIGRSADDARQSLRRWVLQGPSERAYRSSAPEETLSQIQSLSQAVIGNIGKEGIYASVLSYFSLLKSDADSLRRGFVSLLLSARESGWKSDAFWQQLDRCREIESKDEAVDQAAGFFSAEEEECRLPPKDYLQQAVAYIMNHFTQPITLSEIADHLQVTPGYLSKIFSEGMGEPYIKFIARLRMEHAAGLLRDASERRIAQVAELSGYCSVKHFTHVFKEYYGVTPGQYQRDAKQTEGDSH